ncbi:MAG: natural resistance-associated macrophage protein [Parcubacteria group bacterium Gr01-1014_2]|nr:MAG: natural resistance-associated macrophage protein [Parcubacteria group bacterium Gr01-1014_2]
MIVKKLKKIWRFFGPGFITGAVDDDPVGIATYAIAGSKLGFSSLWTAFFTYPLMTAVQEMCARIGIITKMGLAGVLKKHYPFLFLVLVALLMVSANILNIGADISGMSATTNLLIPWVPEKALALVYSLLIVYLMIFLNFKKLIKYFKWLSLTLLFYMAAALFVPHDWTEVLKYIITPKLTLNKETISLIIAVFGTTISPYLFFWQTTEEAIEEKNHHHEHWHIHDEKLKKEITHMEEDVSLGMFFSNLIMFFVMMLAATLFFGQGVSITTINELSKLLKPLLGSLGQWIFTFGIVGTGLLVIPVLAASSAYILAETFGWKEGLEKKFHRAKEFYLVIILSTLLALLMNYFNFNPVKLLFYTALFHGIISPFLILTILSISNNKKVMGTYVNSSLSNILGFGAFMIMAVAVILYFIL